MTVRISGQSKGELGGTEFPHRLSRTLTTGRNPTKQFPVR